MIKEIGAIQGGPQTTPEEAGSSSLPSLPSVQLSPQAPESSDPERVEGQVEQVEALTRDEKRRLLAQMVRVNPLDCFDDSGAFDLTRARRVLPPCAVQQIVIHETTRTDKKGNTTTQRRITLRLVDKVRAMRLDDLLEDREDALNYRRPLTRAEFEASRKRKMAEESEKAAARELAERERQRAELAQQDREERRKEAEERSRQLKESRRETPPSKVVSEVEGQPPVKTEATNNPPAAAAPPDTPPPPPRRPRSPPPAPPTVKMMPEAWGTVREY